MNKTRKAKIFVNVATKNLQASVGFFKKLGFDFNPKFTDDRAACMIFSDDAYMMILAEPFFQSFTKKGLCDTATQNESLLAISCDSRADVDDIVNKAIAAGGKRALDPVDHGFMYSWSFYDLDGHHWEPLWMDPQAV